MKVSARIVSGSTVALFCQPFLGTPRTVYAHWTGNEWVSSSGRSLSRSMLDAIDGLPGISFRGNP